MHTTSKSVVLEVALSSPVLQCIFQLHSGSLPGTFSPLLRFTIDFHRFTYSQVAPSPILSFTTNPGSRSVLCVAKLSRLQGSTICGGGATACASYINKIYIYIYIYIFVMDTMCSVPYESYIRTLSLSIFLSFYLFLSI